MRKQEKLLGAVLLGMATFAPMAGAATVDAAVKQALNTNPDVQASINERQVRSEELRQARAGYLPTVDLSAGVGLENTDSPYTRSAGNKGYVALTRREATISARENVFAGLATMNESARQQARVNAAKFSVQGSAQNVALETIRAYLDVLRREEQLKLAQQYLAAHQNIYDRVKRRSESGVGRVADYEQVQGRLALARSAVISAQRDLDDARSAYQRVVGVMPSEPMSPPQLSSSVMPTSLMTAEAMALREHPTLKSAEADVAAAEAQNKVGNSTFYPHVDVVASQTWGRDLDGLEGLNRRNSVMVEGRYNLFNGGGDAAKSRQYGYRLKQAQDVRDSTKRQVLEAVRLSWSAYQAANEQLKYLKIHEESSRNARDAYIKQFNVGRRTLLDVLDTEKELYEASRAYVAAEYDRIYAQYRVLAGVGTLLKDMGVGAATTAKASSMLAPRS